MPKPILLLAFANEQARLPRAAGQARPTDMAGQAYLRNLPRELNALKAILERAEEDGLCEVEILTNTTLPQLVDTFRKPQYRDRIALLHYSGHADSLELLLETGEQRSARAHAAGLVPLIADQRSLQLVFLNGCFSIQQAKQLLEHGLPAVVGTVRAVADALATDLSISFYKGVASGLSIDRAWNMAVQEAQAQRGAGDMSEYYHQAQRGPDIGGGGASRFPWELHYRDAEGPAPQWNLPAASGSPLFGLPPLDEKRYPPPNEPFRYLERYTPEDAAVFFGRGSAIRQLYEQVTAAAGAPLILLHGQSGVGKSSLLQAGLLPRLGDSYEVVYLRRDRSKGLTRQLLEALGVPEVNPVLSEAERAASQQRITEDIRQLEQTVANLEGDAKTQVEQIIGKYRAELATLAKDVHMDAEPTKKYWFAREQEKGKPLLVIVDQVEEVFTRPHPDITDELGGFLAQAQEIFNPPTEAPQGKLLLSYRKEYHPEIVKATKQYKLLKEDAFLTKLDKAGIVEIVTGLTSRPELRRKYNLAVAPALPLEMANNLLSDPDSPIAPVLQIVLTKMWHAQREAAQPQFTVEAYRQLKEKGILLSDFFQQQMGKIREWEVQNGQQALSSGLALDLLNYHTTDLGTAESRNLRQLEMLYQHQSELVQQLIREFKANYLLFALDAQHTALAHDTLAPIVQQRMRDSDKPGQRALRILEAKVIDYIANPDQAIIEEDDLAAVENGAMGMRVWLPMEIELIEKSRKRRAALQAERRRNRLFRRVAVVLIALFAVAASLLWWQATRRGQQLANEAQFTQGRLLAQHDPTQGLAEVLAAYKTAQQPAMLEEAYQIYRDNPLYRVAHRSDSGIHTAAFSPNGQYVATAVQADHNVRLYRVADGELVATFDQAKSACYALHFDGDNRLYIGSEDRNAYQWDWSAGRDKTFAAAERGTAVKEVVATTDGAWLLTRQADSTATLWSVGEERAVWRQGYDAAAVGSGIAAIGVSPGRLFWTCSRDGRLKARDESGNTIHELVASSRRAVAHFAVSDQTVVLGFEQGGMQVWQKEAPTQWKSVGHEGALWSFEAMALSADGRILLGAMPGGEVLLWDTKGRKPVTRLKGHRKAVHSLAFGANGRRALTAAGDSTLRLWRVAHPYPTEAIPLSNYSITSMMHSRDGQQIAITDGANQLHVVDSKGRAVRAAIDWPGLLSTWAHWMPNGQEVIGGNEDGQLKWVEVSSGQEVRALPRHQGEVTAISLVDDYLLTAGEDGQLILSDPQGEGVKQQSTTSTAMDVLVVPGADCALSLHQGTCRIWNLPDMGFRKEVALEGTALTVVPHPEPDKCLIMTTMGLWVVQLPKGQILSQRLTGDLLVGHRGTPVYLTSGPADGQLRLYAQSGYLLQELNCGSTCVTSSVALQPGGRQVMVGTQQGRLFIWEGLAEPLSPLHR